MGTPYKACYFLIAIFSYSVKRVYAVLRARHLVSIHFWLKPLGLRGSMNAFFGPVDQLDSSRWWQSLVRKHQPLSTTLRSGIDRRNKVRSALQDLMDSSPSTQEVTFEWSQFNCLANRSGGSSACSYITKSIMHGFMAGHLSLSDILNDSKMRDLTVKGVEACDASYPTRGDAPEMLPFLKEDLPATLRVTLETSCHKHEACRLLCREMPPACVAATAFKAKEANCATWH